MKKTHLLLLVIFLSVMSCGNIFQEKDKVDSYVEKIYLNCKENCTIDFNNLFNYDKIYVFGVGVTNDEVSKKLGFEYTGDKDVSRLILFVKNNQIVYEQNIVFDPDSNPYKIVFDSEKEDFDKTTKFEIHKDNERELYVLKPL